MKNVLKTFVKSFTVYALSPSICGPGSTWFLLLTKQTLFLATALPEYTV